MGMSGKRGVSARTSRNCVELGWTRSWRPCGEAQLSLSTPAQREGWEPRDCVGPSGGMRAPAPRADAAGAGTGRVPHLQEVGGHGEGDSQAPGSGVKNKSRDCIL